ncbi:MAG: type II toxin-antitoxin system PemK/MazF family toxin [Dehalococcoidia bacterium]|nr:type II toxin-antitoxin system PemK/MazF family toxin [Dehalococcoidia bacterium]
MVVRQGDIYWVDLGPPYGSEPGWRRPVVVLQNDGVNESSINTVIICIVTSNMARAGNPGNVVLRADESGLRRVSVANVSQIQTIDRARLGEFVARLPAHLVQRILAGLNLILSPSR